MWLACGRAEGVAGEAAAGGRQRTFATRVPIRRTARVAAWLGGSSVRVAFASASTYWAHEQGEGPVSRCRGGASGWRVAVHRGREPPCAGPTLGAGRRQSPQAAAPRTSLDYENATPRDAGTPKPLLPKSERSVGGEGGAAACIIAKRTCWKVCLPRSASRSGLMRMACLQEQQACSAAGCSEGAAYGTAATQNQRSQERRCPLGRRRHRRQALPSPHTCRRTSQR